MQRLKNSANSPPDNFRYTHETGYVSRAIDPYTWFQDIVAHRAGNNLPPITLAQAEDQLCQQLPPGNCEHDDSEKASRNWVNTRLSFSDIVAGTKAYVALIASGFQTVSQEEADRRGRVCASCFLNIQPQGCGACVKLTSLITGDIALKKTVHDSALVNKACAVCHCGTKSIVHFPMPLLDQADSVDKQAAYPDFCWRRQGGSNRID